MWTFKKCGENVTIGLHANATARVNFLVSSNVNQAHGTNGAIEFYLKT